MTTNSISNTGKLVTGSVRRNDDRVWYDKEKKNILNRFENIARISVSNESERPERFDLSNIPFLPVDAFVSFAPAPMTGTQNYNNGFADGDFMHSNTLSDFCTIHNHI